MAASSSHTSKGSRRDDSNAAVPGSGSDCARCERQATLAELVLQLFGIGRQVAERAEFNRAETRLDDLVEECRPVRLLWVIGEPDASGVWRGPQVQPRVLRLGGRGGADYGRHHGLLFQVSGVGQGEVVDTTEVPVAADC